MKKLKVGKFKLEETTAEDRYAAEVLGVFPPNPKFDEKRADANAKLIQILAQYLTDNPDQRFGQALRNLDIIREERLGRRDDRSPPDWVNEFNTEPTEMVDRALASLRNRQPWSRR